MKFQLATFLTSILALGALANHHNPHNHRKHRVEDVGKTSIALASDPTNPDHFLITVERIDDLVTKNGQPLAERIISIALNFYVEGENLLLNGNKIVPLGNDATVTAVNATYVRGDISKEKAKHLVKHFDQGLVNVAVTTAVEDFVLVDEEGNKALGRRISIHEKILEVEGKEVIQTEFSEQVLDLYANGTLIRKVSEPKLESLVIIKALNSKYACNGAKAWARLPALVRGSIVGALIGLLLSVLVYLPIVLFIRRRRRNSTPSYESIATEEDVLPSYHEKDATIFREVDVKEEEKITAMEAIVNEERHL